MESRPYRQLGGGPESEADHSNNLSELNRLRPDVSLTPMAHVFLNASLNPKRATPAHRGKGKGLKPGCKLLGLGVYGLRAVEGRRFRICLGLIRVLGCALG